MNTLSNTSTTSKRHCLSVAVAVVLAFIQVVANAAAPARPEMTAHYINVGQGAATLLEFPCGLILIDTGGGSDEYTAELIAHLNGVFMRRPELNRKLESVVITHPHIDHTRGLRKVMETFTVKRYIDDGEIRGSGRYNPQWVRKAVQSGEQQAKIVEIDDHDIPAAGLTNADIDPLKCALCDPKITILMGGIKENPGWAEVDFDNLNNHSVVVRVDFGKSTFLFSGDLEEAGIAHLVKKFKRTKLLDVDVYMVGHHGAANATNPAFLAAVTPQMAVISMGKWNEGRQPYNPFSTYAYGHPRINVLEALSEFIPEERVPVLKVMAGTGARKFSEYEVEKQIYATGWDGTIRVISTLDGEYSVKKN